MLRGVFSRLSSVRSGRVIQRLPKRRQVGRRRSRMIAEQLESRCYLSGDPIVQVDTNFGNFQIELLPSAAPQTVANFLSYVDSGKYNDLVFSRNVPGFIIQAGQETSPTATYTSDSQFVPVTPGPTIPLEYNLPNTTGTLAMARVSGQANSAAAEWFINLTDNTQTLGPTGTDKPNGYAVFAKVLGNGMQVVNAISAALPNTDNGNKPVTSGNQLALITSMSLDVYGTVFADVNANGTQDSGEAGVAGRTVFVNVDGTDKPDNSNPSATTDVNGNYDIDVTGVRAGSYQVKEVVPSGLVSTTPSQTVAIGTSSTNVNLGETKPSISGTVFVDLNGSGKPDTGDPGLANQTVFLNNDKSGKPDNNPKTTTDASGNFSFTGLAAGSYNVMVQLPTNVTSSTNTQSIAVTAGQTATANIGELPSIAGMVFNDLSVSGKFNTGDPGVAGVTVFLNNDNTGKPDNNPKATTDTNGRFYFMGLTSGPYTVQEVVSPNHGVTVTTPAAAVTVGTTLPAQASIGDVLTSPIAPVPVSTARPAAASDANTAYINALYQYVLGRAPDSDGLTFWQSQLGSTTPSAATLNSVADGFWTSPEHRSFQVEQYFLEFLGRPYDADGKNTWMSNFTSKTTGPATNDETAAIGFLTTAEYQALHSGNTALVDALYNDIELHAADPANNWVSQLDSGAVKYAQVVNDFVNGAEANTRLVDSLYSVFLHRAPDSSDLSGLVDELNSGTLNADGAAIKLLSSTELYKDAQAPQFITPSSATFTAGTAGSFTVKTSGVIGTITGSGLPASGLTLTDNHDGTATLASNTTLAAGTYNLQLTVSNSVGTAKQNFTLTVQ